MIICLSQCIIFKQPVKHIAMWTRFRQIKSKGVRCMFVFTWILLVWIIMTCWSHKGESYNHCCNHITPRNDFENQRLQQLFKLSCCNCTPHQILYCLYAGVFFLSLNLFIIIIIWWFFHWNILLICFVKNLIITTTKKILSTTKSKHVEGILFLCFYFPCK